MILVNNVADRLQSKNVETLLYFVSSYNKM
jgi:hypothetical protein